ncbi:MAG TPA: toprim domain-containing protein [Candidatus Paceibacterota bacterium]|nr:toprim domain-containing protein [Candidatus Paceibacterota bacterium]
MNTKLPESVRKLSHALAELPSIGPRQATRLAFYLVEQGADSIRELAKNIDDLSRVKICERCFFVHQNKDALCDICRNPARRTDVIAIVEKETDLISLENADKFSGRYLILGPIPKTGLLRDPQKLRLQGLKSFIQKELGGRAEEIVLAFNPTSAGDFHASLLAKELGGFTKKISRLGRGLPTGGEIEFADDETLGSALERRS